MFACVVTVIRRCESWQRNFQKLYCHVPFQPQRTKSLNPSFLFILLPYLNTFFGSLLSYDIYVTIGFWSDSPMSKNVSKVGNSLSHSLLAMVIYIHHCTWCCPLSPTQQNTLCPRNCYFWLDVWKFKMFLLAAFFLQSSHGYQKFH